MKKIIYLFVATLLLFTSCDNEQDPIFDDSPETRINNVLTKYKTTLTKDDGTWIAYYSGSAILMKFNNDNTVEFKSTYGDGSDDKIISYRVGISQVPELIFESHSVFQAIYEDNRATGEYEFLFDKVADDRIDFISKTDKGTNKTKLTFFKGTETDLTKAKELTDKINILSVFKEVVINGDTQHKIAISLNPGGKARVTTLFEGKIVSENYSYDVTASGVIFQPALSIGDGLEAAEFSFDETTQVFQSTDETKVSINVVNEPVLPLAPYAFGVKGNAKFNTLDSNDKSSLAFSTFYNLFVENFKANYGGRTIYKWYLRGLNSSDAKYIQIYYARGANGYSVRYYFTYEVKDDGKVYFNSTGENTAGTRDEGFQPLVQKIFNTKGHHLESTGKLEKYTNSTFSMINADDTSMRINFFDF